MTRMGYSLGEKIQNLKRNLLEGRRNREWELNQPVKRFWHRIGRDEGGIKVGGGDVHLGGGFPE